ncbi:MAG: hypothetical protein JSV27_01310 [Candidatus Bathyarchaeota archaeon]|nr:MAG: hypothetical protein JSV27_01310 [Candidatus Bathyarchaeota archaeon]
MSRKSVRASFLLMVLIGSAIVVHTATTARAATFDGTYDYAYNLNGPEGWEAHRVPKGFIVSQGRISSDPPALSGSVDSSGNARFEGSSPYGGSVAIFTGTIDPDGAGEGTYEDQQGLGGRWTVTRVSGPGGFNVERILYSLSGLFSDIGEMLGASGSTAVAFGVAAVVVPPIVIWVIASTFSVRRRRTGAATGIGYRRERSDSASKLAPPPTGQTGVVAPPIGAPTGPSLLGAGVHWGPPDLPSSLDLRAKWGEGRVVLRWDPPPFDAGTFRLDEYVVSRMQYRPGSTAPEKLQIARLTPQETQWRGSFTQTYRWNTGGDIESFVVEAVLRHFSSTGHPGTVRIGGIAYVPP